MKVRYVNERQQILKECEDMKNRLELNLTEDREKIFRNTQEKVTRNENEFRCE